MAGAEHVARWLCAVAAAIVVAALVTGDARPTPVPARTVSHIISYDRYSLKIDGRRVYIWSGEFHYWRLPSPGAWLDVLQKLKAAGYNATSIYFDWGYHSPKPGVYDFSGVRDVDRLLALAARVGLYVIARPGPYINAETDAGGFPGWLVTQQGRARSSAPDYTAAYREWLRHIDPIIARHQLTDGTGTVIAYQVENENGFNADPAYMADLERQARADGITVPLTANHCCGPATWATGPGAVDLPGQDAYPQRFDCSNPARWRPVTRLPRLRADAPIFTPEFQGGAFDPWGGPGYDRCRALTGPDFERVFYKENIIDGATLQSFYMAYGGTSWGWLATPSRVYSSYDYGAAISEDRELTPKYDEMKRLGLMVASVAPLTETRRARAAPATDRAVRVAVRENPDDHTRFYELRHANSRSTATDRTHIAIAGYPRVPQQPGTAITLAGRDAKLLIAGYAMDGQQVRYSTSELMTHAPIGGRDVALLYGRAGEDGETVLGYPARPRVTVRAGAVRVHWDAGRHDLRLDYVHRGLIDVSIRPAGGRPLELLLATDAVAAEFWRPADDVLVRGPELVRTAAVRGATLALTGDTDAPCALTVIAPPAVTSVTWNGRAVATRRVAGGALRGRLAGPAPVALPALRRWRFHPGSPEARPGFPDAGWARADKPVLSADAYGFHHGDVWYRGRFTARGGETGVRLSALTGRAGVYSAWLNGRFLGSSDAHRHRFAFPGGSLRRDNVLSVMVENMGHDEDFVADDSHKRPRGLTGARILGSPAPIAWRIQGNRGGEDLADPVRGPMNAGGLYGERSGWALPGYPDGTWRSVRLPHRVAAPGEAWLRTTFALHVPAGHDVPLGIRIADSPRRRYRALLFVNGWLIGRYVNAVGPQRSFPIPAGIVRADGRNTLAVAVWNEGRSRGGLGRVSLQRYANLATSLRIGDVASPGYRPA